MRERKNYYMWLKEGLAWRWKRLKNGIHEVNRRFFKHAQNRYIRTNGDYDAAGYWADRHRDHLHSFRGVGNLSRTEAENVADYVDAARVMAGLLRSLGCNPRGKSMLDIGCGNGFWTGAFQRWGISQYTGIDITDIMFPFLERRHPGFRFVAGDILEIPLDAGFDLVTMIDVTQHIVDDGRLERVLKRVRRSMNKDSVFIVTFWNQLRPQENFYEKFRLFTFYTRVLDGLAHTEPLRFRDKFIAAFYDVSRRPDRTYPEPLSEASIFEMAGEILRA